ncbi:heavy-metal-associated domain-containing protein [Microbacterium lacticum]|uniref:heavy-metal-associated domain-containing protein n=1 Tax=Microbacterium lacticum TaxID=33885 RepID=UPI001F594D5D|nr:cation transporter [Microbacterium lacticum]
MTEHIDLGLKDATAGCACCATPTSAAAEAPVAATGVTEDILVSGMTCSHCVSSVTDELTGIDGVQNVTVDLRAGGASHVTIHSTVPLDASALKAAAKGAGYDLVDSPV